MARGFQILQCFTETRRELTVSQLAKLTGLPQPTVWRLCHTMLELGMLQIDPTDRLRPGLAVLQLGFAALAGDGFITMARPHMQALADEFGAACGLGIRSGAYMVFVERCESENQLLLNLRTGSRIPILTSAFGWAYIAGHPEPERGQLMAEMQKLDPATYRQWEKGLAAAIAEYESRGFVINAGVFHKAYNTAAVPLRAADGTIPYVLNCGSAAATLPEAVLRERVAPRLSELARLLTELLGRADLS
nr:IclR family transcriptional regulator [Paracoccus sp. S1E-3]